MRVGLVVVVLGTRGRSSGREALGAQTGFPFRNRAGARWLFRCRTSGHLGRLSLLTPLMAMSRRSPIRGPRAVRDLLTWKRIQVLVQAVLAHELLRPERLTIRAPGLIHPAWRSWRRAGHVSCLVCDGPQVHRRCSHPAIAVTASAHGLGNGSKALVANCEKRGSSSLCLCW
jgi:hypothetical protein